jgi:hypothetical protein
MWHMKTLVVVTGLGLLLCCHVRTGSAQPPVHTELIRVKEVEPREPTPTLRPGSFDARTGKARDLALSTGGGTKESEQAVARGLKWLAKNQHAEGKWQLDGAYPDPGAANDVAGTAFGLLPLLAAGYTHKADPNNPFDRPVQKGLAFLIRRQNRRTGEFGQGMYAHALATIAVCEDYGMTKDPLVRQAAQKAVDYIVQAQHEGGGWRYAPSQAGDTSSTGFQIMALTAARTAGLNVPKDTLKNAAAYLDSVTDGDDEGCGYTGRGSTRNMSAVGILCRQHLSDWGPKHPRLNKAVNNHLNNAPPGTVSDMYYYYYATQVMHHLGGPSWKGWNENMRDRLVASQVKDGDLAGSWDSRGDPYSAAGGRLMQTSLSLLTLEIYYRHVPLFPSKLPAPEGK